MSYSRKTIQDLKPQWYMDLNTKDKNKRQAEMKKEKAEMWEDKPKLLIKGSFVTAKESIKNITEGRKYKVLGHFCTLVTTVYYSCWNEFITIKNDYGYTVKMSLRKFDKPKQ